MAEHFMAGDPVPGDWYDAPNLRPFRFGVDVMSEVVGGRRRVMPVCPLGPDDVLVRSEGAVDQTRDCHITFDPPCDFITV